MALIWQSKRSGVNYEVRSAGKTLRLYTDGVFHSQYNPGQPLTGHVWDLLMLPAFFYPKKRIKRVLVLGVGGGAVMHQLLHFVQPEQIVGVELNPQHVSIARRFFGLKHSSIKLVTADAIAWLKQYRGEKFDMIVDDLFAEKDGEPVAVTDANRSWFSLMLKHLNKEGVVVRNFIDKQALLQSAPLTNDAIARRFSSVFQLTSFFNENHVGVFLRKESTSAGLRDHLKQVPGLNPSLKTSKLRYRIRRLV